MVVGSRCCPLILWLALAAALGSVLGLGEDLDRPLFGPPGSPVRLHESDPGLKKALLFAEERYNRGSNAMHLRKVSRFISATKQVKVSSLIDLCSICILCYFEILLYSCVSLECQHFYNVFQCHELVIVCT